MAEETCAAAMDEEWPESGIVNHNPPHQQQEQEGSSTTLMNTRRTNGTAEERASEYKAALARNSAREREVTAALTECYAVLADAKKKQSGQNAVPAPQQPLAPRSLSTPGPSSQIPSLMSSSGKSNRSVPPALQLAHTFGSHRCRTRLLYKQHWTSCYLTIKRGGSEKNPWS